MAGRSCHSDACSVILLSITNLHTVILDQPAKTGLAGSDLLGSPIRRTRDGIPAEWRGRGARAAEIDRASARPQSEA
jgi:hypothetical protein